MICIAPRSGTESGRMSYINGNYTCGLILCYKNKRAISLALINRQRLIISYFLNSQMHK